jgi:hypothetical protein
MFSGFAEGSVYDKEGKGTTSVVPLVLGVCGFSRCGLLWGNFLEELC